MRNLLDPRCLPLQDISGLDMSNQRALRPREFEPPTSKPTSISDRPKLLIVGYGRHGKDYLAERIEDKTQLRYGGSTSWAALPHVAASLNMHPQRAWESRQLHRDYWFDFCNFLRRDDPLFLIREVLCSGDLVVGIRDKEEMHAARESGLFRRIIWVDAYRRLGTVDTTVKFGPADCDEIISNNGSRDDFEPAINSLIERLALPLKES